MNNCYVYVHYDPQEGAVYVGMGRGHRCLDTHKRSPEHAAWMQHRFSQDGIGFIHIHTKNLTEKEARRIEAREVRALKPRFNKQMNGAANAGRGSKNHNALWTDDEVAYWRLTYAKEGGSLRAFHRNHMSQYSFGSVRKMLTGLSYV